MAWCPPGTWPALSAHALCFWHCSHFPSCGGGPGPPLLHFIFPLLFANKRATSRLICVDAAAGVFWTAVSHCSTNPPPAPRQMQDRLANVAALPTCLEPTGGAVGPLLCSLLHP